MCMGVYKLYLVSTANSLEEFYSEDCVYLVFVWDFIRGLCICRKQFQPMEICEVVGV